MIIKNNNRIKKNLICGLQLLRYSRRSIKYLQQGNVEMERPRREDGQQMDTQAHHVGPQRRQKERGTITDEKGWPTQKKCERQSVVERT